MEFWALTMGDALSGNKGRVLEGLTTREDVDRFLKAQHYGARAFGGGFSTVVRIYLGRPEPGGANLYAKADHRDGKYEILCGRELKLPKEEPLFSSPSTGVVGSDTPR